MKQLGREPAELLPIVQEGVRLRIGLARGISRSSDPHGPLAAGKQEIRFVRRRREDGPTIEVPVQEPLSMEDFQAKSDAS